MGMGMGMGMRIDFENPMGMSVDTGITFENGYGCGYIIFAPNPAYAHPYSTW